MATRLIAGNSIIFPALGWDYKNNPAAVSRARARTRARDDLTFYIPLSFSSKYVL